MYTIPFTQEMIDKAIEMANGITFKDSRTQVKHSGEGLSDVATAGFLAEEAVAAHLDAGLTSTSTSTDKYHYDLVLQNGLNTEVKTKRRTVPPRLDYDVSIYDISTFQRPDLYMFVSLEFEKSTKKGKTLQYDNLKNVWLLGQKTPADFFNKAVLWKAGDYDPRNKLRLKSNTYNLGIYQLDAIGDLSDDYIDWG